MDTKALRQKILDLAIRGKLVPQDPNDEPASVLLERIRAEKQQMVNDGKLKAKDIKNDTVIFLGDDNLHYEKFPDSTVKCIEDEIPFDLPDGWCWDRLGNVSNIARGGSPRPIESYITDDENGINWIKIGDTEKDGKYIFKTKEKIKPEGLSKSRYVESGDFLLTNSMSFGRPYILKTDGCIHDGWLVIGNIDTVFDQNFLYYALSSDFMYQTLSLLAAGSTVKNLKSDTVKSVLFPIPPIQEQKRIAEKLDSLISYVIRIDSDKTDLQSTIQLTKSKILDLAIRGKLVPQNSDDEPASVLLDRIRTEKEELIKQGKIKRDKKESVIYKGDDNSYYEKIGNTVTCIDEELPFELPKSWEWCNLSMIGQTNIGLTYSPADIVPDNGTIVFRSSNIINNQLDYSDLVRVNKSIRDNQYLANNDILICARNGSKALVGKCALIKNLSERASFGAFMAIYRTTFYTYVFYFLQTSIFRDTFHDSNSTAINQLTQAMIKKTRIPLPPFEEQLRIVEYLNKYFDLLNYIEKSLN